ncbi:hypothetical protein [Parvibacter caecicola]|uniref:hypothetical protein n=1 Tax=Parvibacter caecicola TaxID=747645 RepID=UPI00249A45C8|nr:hypothetical protein [Parvibacter caecicola]
MKITREKIALLIFAALLAVVAAASVSYFFTSRNFNVAASYVDDQVGSMEDYTVVVYNGTVEPQEESDAADTAAPWMGNGAPAGQEGTDAQVEEGRKILELGEAEDGLGHKVYLSDVNDLYREKGASVLSLNLTKAGQYEEPQLFTVGERKIGVLEVSAYVSERKLKKLADGLRERGASSVICIARTTVLLASPASVDVLIVTGPEKDLSVDGGFVDGTFVVRTPDVGSVGALVINHANVVSARVISPE